VVVVILGQELIEVTLTEPPVPLRPSADTACYSL